MKKCLLIVLAILLLTACSAGAPSFPTGNYQSNHGSARWSFNADGSWTRETLGGEIVGGVGSYSVEGEQITLTGPVDECGDSPGVYNWSVDEDGVLDFEKVEEECTHRIRLIYGVTPLP